MNIYPIYNQSLQINNDTVDDTNSFDISKLRTGDLLFFHTNSMPAAIVQYACHSNWCHIALVVLATRNELGISISPYGDDIRDNVKELYIFESSTFIDKSPCVMNGVIHSGVRLIKLAPRFANIKSTVGVLQLKIIRDKINNTPLTSNQANLQQNIINFIKRESGKPYEENLNNLVRVWWHSVAWINFCGGDNIEDTTSYFCSELMAEILSQVGVIKSRAIPDRFGGLTITQFPSSNFAITDFENPRLLNRDYINTKEFIYTPRDKMLYIQMGKYAVKRY